MGSAGCLGYAQAAGIDMEARLVKASVSYPASDLCLVPEPRGAFSNLKPVAVPALDLDPEQIQLQPLVGVSLYMGETLLTGMPKDQICHLIFIGST